MKVYKGTDKNMVCNPSGDNPFQYEIGKTYEKPKAELCRHGFHACEAPLDVMRYYRPNGASRYFEAEIEEVSDERSSDDTKVCGKKITLGAEIGIPELAKAHVEYVKELCKKSADGNASGDYDNAAASGESGNAAASCDYGNAAASGMSSNAAASGMRGTAVCSGEFGSAEANGEQTVAVAWGLHSKARGKIGSWIVCVEYDKNEKIKNAKMVMIDGETIKPDTWYTLKYGEFVEVSDDT